MGAGTPILVLHGGPGIGYRYLLPELPALLADRARLIFFDQRGSGESSGVEDRSRLDIGEFVEDVERVRRELGLDRVLLLGHSFGGLLALHYTLAFPEQVAGLILVDSDPATYQHWSRFSDVIRARQTQSEKERLGAIQATEGWQQSAELVATYYGTALRPYFAHASMPADFGSRFITTPLENLFITPAAVRASLGQWNLARVLDRIECPALVLAGRASIFPSEAAEILAAGVAHGALRIIKGASHFPHLEAPDAFRGAVLGFLDDRSARK
jgi:proline iminopeptidase